MKINIKIIMYVLLAFFSINSNAQEDVRIEVEQSESLRQFTRVCQDIYNIPLHPYVVTVTNNSKMPIVIDKTSFVPQLISQEEFEQLTRIPFQKSTLLGAMSISLLGVFSLWYGHKESRAMQQSMNDIRNGNVGGKIFYFGPTWQFKFLGFSGIAAGLALGWYYFKINQAQKYLHTLAQYIMPTHYSYTLHASESKKFLMLFKDAVETIGLNTQ